MMIQNIKNIDKPMQCGNTSGICACRAREQSKKKLTEYISYREAMLSTAVCQIAGGEDETLLQRENYFLIQCFVW